MKSRARISTRTLVRLARAGQVFCLLMSLSGVLLIAFGAPEPAAAQGKCASVCSGDDLGACIWCERWEHSGWGTMAAGSALVLGGLGGALTLGQLCRGLESGGGVGVADAGVSGDGGQPVEGPAAGGEPGVTGTGQEERGQFPGGRLVGGSPTEGGGEEGAPRPATAEGEGGESAAPARAEGEAGAPAAAPAGPLPPGPSSDAARDRWNLLNADGEGRVYGPGHQHILNVDADGNVTDLSGRPVQQVIQDDISTRIQTYVDADGNEIRIDADGQAWRTTDMGGEERFDLPTSPAPRPGLRPDVALRWDLSGAGPGGELYAPDGSVIGRIDADGNMWTNDGARITGHDTPDGGRLRSFDADGQMWTWTEDGGYKPTKLPEGPTFRPPSQQEWQRLDAQRAAQNAPTQVDSGGASSDQPAGPGTLVEGEQGGRHISPELADRLGARTGGPGTQVEGPAGETRFPAGADTRVYGEQPGQRTPSSDAQQARSGTTQVDDGGGGGAAPGAPTEVEGGEPRATGTAADAEGGRASAPAAGAGAEPARAGAGDAEAPRAGAADSQTPRAAGAPEGEARAAGAQGEGGGLVGTGFSRAMDAQNVQQLYNQHVRDGKSPAEAFALAVAQTGAGNLAGGTNPFGGVTDPRLSAAAGALLPGGMSNILPDKAVENFVGTGYDALEAVSDSLGASVGSGQLDTTALDNFAERVASRPNADPFAGYAQAAQLVGEETARTDGGNLVSDLQQIYDTGAGSEVLNESMAGFQQRVERGEFGAPLQGLNDLASAASEVIADPTTTIGQFVDDVRNIYNHGVGDGFWDEALNNTANVIKNTPVAGTIYDGYHQVFSGVAEQGVTDFASEMAEGAYALGQEAYDAAGNALADAADSTYKYIRSFF